MKRYRCLFALLLTGLAIICASCDPVKLIPPLGLGKTYPPETLKATGPGSIRGTLLIEAPEAQVSDSGPITAANPGRYAGLRAPVQLMLYRAGELTPTRETRDYQLLLPGDGDGVFPYSFTFTNLPLASYRVVLAGHDETGYHVNWEGPSVTLTQAAPDATGVSAPYFMDSADGTGELAGKLVVDGNPPMLGWVYLSYSRTSAPGTPVATEGAASWRAEYPDLQAGRVWYRLSRLRNGSFYPNVLPASFSDSLEPLSGLRIRVNGQDAASATVDVAAGQPAPQVDFICRSVWYPEHILTEGGTIWPDPQDHTLAVRLLGFSPPPGAGDCFLEATSATGDTARNARLWRYIAPEQYGLESNIVQGRSLKSGRYNLRLIRLGATNAQREVLASYPVAVRLSDPQPGWIEPDGGSSTQLLEWAP